MKKLRKNNLDILIFNIIVCIKIPINFYISKPLTTIPT